MKSPFTTVFKPHRSFRRRFLVAPVRVFAVAAALVAALSWNAAGQSDDFDDGNDAGWSKITDSNYPATYSFPADVYGGHAYRLRGAAPGGTIGGANTARVVAYRPDRTYTNFYVAADIVDWDASTTNDQAFGLVARANDVASGLVNAATFVVRINRFRGSGTSRGQVYIYSFVNGTAPDSAAAAAANCTLLPGHKYRLVFMGTNEPASGWTYFSGRIYDLEDLTRPLVSLNGDSVLASLFGAFPSSGYSGLFNVSLGTNPAEVDPTTDTTFDNFVASERPPVSVAEPGTPHGVPGMPQVVNRAPASFANFHPAANGITFNATTLTATNSIETAATKLFLNGLDVSSGLIIAWPPTNAAVSYFGLTSNAVYDARIELQDVLGRRTTNVWTFDTFTDSYLAAAGAKNIECEDYDFDSGKFMDDPPPSGYTTNATLINSDLGYVDRIGLNAKFGGVDYFDYDNSPSATEKDFRPSDGVGTQQGTAEALYSDGTNPSVIVTVRAYETLRQKYAEASPGEPGALQEYVVRRTEGGEWLNYTRVFAGSNYYNVYLRVGCYLGQQLFLGGLPNTNDLGTFTVPSAVSIYNYRYVPLRNAAGNLAVVNLAGTNTLRLTVAPPQIEGTKQGLSMNYLAFVPALLVESAPQVTGPYALETNASVEPGTRRITIPAGSATRFYRLRWDRAVRITGMDFAEVNVFLTYQ